MNSCLECTAETKNPKFCTRSCAAKHNNTKSPKRKLEGACAGCRAAISSTRKYCSTCPIERSSQMVVKSAQPGPTHPKTVGDRCELEIAYQLTKAGLFVLSPHLGENSRYDLIADEEGHLFRIQCKSGRLRDGVVLFSTVSSYSHHKTPGKRGYRGEVDLFGVYCPDNGEIYFISPLAVPVGAASLRVDSTKNGVSRGVRWAVDFRWQPGTTLASLEARR